MKSKVGQLRNTVLSLITVLYLCVNAYGQLPYIVAYEDIQEELKEIWHDKKNNQSFLITVDRLCILEEGDLRCRELGVGKNMLFHNQTYDRFNPHPIFLGNYGGFFDLQENTIKSFNISEKYPNSAIYKDGEDLWIAGYEIYKHSKGIIDTIPVIMNSEIPFWDIRKQSNGNLWFVNYASGAYRINKSNNQLRRVSNLNGLPTNNLTSIHITSKDEIFIGYKGGLAQIDDQLKIENFDLRNFVGNEPIKEIESDNLGNLWFLTDKNLGMLNINSKEVKLIPTNPSDDFIIHTIEYNSNKDLMLIGTSKGLYLSSTQGVYFHGEKIYADGPLYYFGDELLLSGKDQVQKFNSLKGHFEKSNYRPIQQSFPCNNGDYWITDTRNVLLLDKEKQEVSNSFRKPTKRFNQIVEIKNEIYLCHDEGIYLRKNGKTSSLVHGDEAFYNVLSCGDKKYAVSEQGIYLIGKGELDHQNEIEGSEKMLKSNKQFFIDEESMLIPSERAIIMVKCSKNEMDFQFFPSLDKVLDFHVRENEIYILHHDRLMMYQRDEYTKNPYNAYCAIPVNADKDSRLFVDDQEKIWLQNSSGLAYVQRNHNKICNILKVGNGEKAELRKEVRAENNILVNEDKSSFMDKLNWPILATLGLIALLLMVLSLTRSTKKV